MWRAVRSSPSSGAHHYQKSPSRAEPPQPDPTRGRALIGENSAKERKALRYIAAGQTIRAVSEKELLGWLGMDVPARTGRTVRAAPQSPSSERQCPAGEDGDREAESVGLLEAAVNGTLKWIGKRRGKSAPASAQDVVRAEAAIHQRIEHRDVVELRQRVISEGSPRDRMPQDIRGPEPVVREETGVQQRRSQSWIRLTSADYLSFRLNKKPDRLATTRNNLTRGRGSGCGSGAKSCSGRRYRRLCQR